MSKNNGLILRGDIWHMRFTLRGEHVAESTHTSNRRAAEQILARRKTDIIERAMLGKLKTIKLHAAIDQFIASRSHLASADTRRNNLNLFKTLPNVSLDNLSHAQAQSVIDARHKTSKLSTVKVTVTYFNAMVNYFAKLDYSVCKKLERIKGVKGRLRWLSDEEEVALFAALNPNLKAKSGDNLIRTKQKQDNYDLCIALRHTGARLAEMSLLQWSHIDFDKKEIQIRRGKGSIDSTIEMSNTLCEMLLHRKKEGKGNFVFPTKVKLNSANNWMSRAVERAGINTADGSVSCHTLRHTAAAKWLQGGLNLAELQQVLGHVDIQSTLVYAHLVPGNASRKAAGILNKRTDKPAERVPATAPMPKFLTAALKPV